MILQLKFRTVANVERRKLFRFGHFNCLKIVQKEKIRISTGKTISVVFFKGAKVLDCTKFFFNLLLKAKMAIQVDIVGNL